MIDTGEYLKIILKKRNMNRNDLVELMKRKGMKNAFKTRISEVIAGKGQYQMLRNIEIALDLKEGELGGADKQGRIMKK